MYIRIFEGYPANEKTDRHANKQDQKHYLLVGDYKSKWRNDAHIPFQQLLYRNKIYFSS